MNGFGSQTIGGNAGTDIWVTNLNTSGTGSFRAACEATIPRHVKFKVAGTVVDHNLLLIRNPFITIDGAAFGMGFQYVGMISFQTHDTITRQIGFKSWDSVDGYEAGNRGCIEYAGDNSFNHVFANNSCFWGVDENASVSGGAHDVTFYKNIVAEGLRSPKKPDGTWLHPDQHPHSKGIMVNHSSGGNVSIIGNLLHSNDDRNPQCMKGNVEVVGNIFINWGFGGRYGNGAHVHFDHNAWLAGPNTPSNRQAIIIDQADSDTFAWLSHNIGPGRETDSGDQWLLAQAVPAANRASAPLFTQINIETRSMDLVMQDVFDHAGRFKRDSEELRICTEAEARLGSWKDQIAGWPGADIYPVYPVRTIIPVVPLPVQT